MDGTIKEDVVWLVELFARRRSATDVPCFVGNSCWIPFLQKSHESMSVFPDALFQASHQSRRWVPKQKRQPSRLLQDADVSINPCIPWDRTRLEAGLSSSSPLSSILRLTPSCGTAIFVGKLLLTKLRRATFPPLINIALILDTANSSAWCSRAR